MDKNKLHKIRIAYNNAKEALRKSDNLGSIEAAHLGQLLNILSDILKDEIETHHGKS